MEKKYLAYRPESIREFARTVYAADYCDSESAKSAVVAFKKSLDNANGNDNVYLSMYFNAACDVSVGLRKEYEDRQKRMQNAEFQRDDAIKTTLENLKSELDSTDGIKNSVFQRIGPAGVIYLPFRASASAWNYLPEYLWWLPEFTGGIISLVIDVKTRLWARNENENIRIIYGKNIKKIGANYLKALAGAEKLCDEANRNRYDRAEDKLWTAYEECYGISFDNEHDPEEKRDSEKYRTDDGAAIKKYLKSVDAIVSSQDGFSEENPEGTIGE